MKKRMKQFFALALSLAVLMGAVPEYAMALPAAEQNDAEAEVSEVEDVEVVEDEEVKVEFSTEAEVTDKAVQSEKTSGEREEIKKEIFKSIDEI